MRLGIPKGGQAIDERLELVQDYFPELHDAIVSVVRSKQSDEERAAQCVSLLNNESLVINDIDRLHLIMGSVMGDAENITDELLITLVDDLEVVTQFSPVEQRKLLHQFGLKIVSYYFPRIRAKLACKELIAAWLERDAVAHLIRITHRYAACPIVQRHIDHIKAQAYFSTNVDEKEAAKKLLNDITSSIKGNTKRKAQMYPAYELYQLQKLIESSIHEWLEGDESALAFLEWLASKQVRLVNIEYVKELKQKPKVIPREFAINMLQKRLGVSNDNDTLLRSFNETIEPKVPSHLKNIGDVVEEMVYSQFADYRHRHPEWEYTVDYWSALERMAY